jgi:hypothetical protein
VTVGVEIETVMFERTRTALTLGRGWVRSAGQAFGDAPRA